MHFCHKVHYLTKTVKQGGIVLQSELNTQKLTPQFETEDLRKLGETGRIADRIIITMSQGLGIMTAHFGLVDVHAEKVKRIRSRQKRIFVILLVYILIAIFATLLQITKNSNSYLTLYLPFAIVFFIILIRSMIKPAIERNAFEQTLKAVCDKMNVDYYSTGLEAQGDGSSWWGFGLIGIASAVTINAASRALRKNKFRTFSLIASYGQIADHFNKTYHAEKYNSLPQKIKLT
jgi:hypothetical protein